MIAFLRDRMDAWLGRGRHSTSVPIMDGPLQPNRRIEEANALFSVPGSDNLTVHDGGLWFSVGNALMRLNGEHPVEIGRLPAPIACLASNGQGMAVGMEGKGIVLRGGRHDGLEIAALGGYPAICPTALQFDGPDRLIVALGSRDHPPSRWKHDLMSRGASGSVWSVDLASGHETALATGLAWPCGLAPADGGAVVSEAWRHRLLTVDAGGTPRAVWSGLPGYPGRIVAAEDGYLLSVFAPRNQLVEFVLRERDYREAMIREVPPDLWIAPALKPPVSFLEPLQGGAVRQMGLLKPWAPTRSYGLVVRLNGRFLPVESWHSRADGRRHGITALAEFHGRLIAASQGTGEALVLPWTTEAPRPQ